MFNSLKLIAAGAAIVAATAAHAQSGYRPGMLGVDTRLRPNPTYMKPTAPAPAPRPAPVISPSRGIPNEFKPQQPMRPRADFERALQKPIVPPAPPLVPPPPPVHAETEPVSRLTIGPNIPVGKDVIVTPTVKGTPPLPTVNAPMPSIEGGGISIQKEMP